MFDELAKMPTQDRRAFASYLVNEVTLVIVLDLHTQIRILHDQYSYLRKDVLKLL